MASSRFVLPMPLRPKRQFNLGENVKSAVPMFLKLSIDSLLIVIACRFVGCKNRMVGVVFPNATDVKPQSVIRTQEADFSLEHCSSAVLPASVGVLPMSLPRLSPLSRRQSRETIRLTLAGIQPKSNDDWG